MTNEELSDINASSINWNIRDELKGLELDEILTYQKKNGFSVCMINTTGSLNIGVVLRSAVLFGADKFYITGKQRYDKRSTVGAHNYIQVDKIKTFDYDLMIERIILDGYTPVFIETNGKPISTIHNDARIYKPCFIFGEEGAGIPEELLSKNYPIFEIPMFGVLRSYNVSVAASIAMYEYTRNN